MFAMVRNLWAYRNFVFSSIRNDLVSRFARSKLGGLWMIINPLAQVAIYVLILSNVLSAKLPGIGNKYAYAIYLMAGLLAWALFNEIVSRCLSLFIEQGNLMKKMQFPRITLPAIVVGSSLLNNGFLLAAMFGVFPLLGHGFSTAMFWLLPLTLILVCFSIGLGLLLGVINVFVRDLGQLVPIALQMLFWFTPIVYPVTIIPENYRHWLSFNPFYHFINAYQSIVVYGNSPDIGSVVVICIVTFLVLAFSLFLFRRASEEMVDAL